jgi:glycosyltransferase involved in cell wall biosynthesis
MVITVAICTWNRAALLDQTLAEMRNLRVPKGVDWELLVVNNNCIDDTDEVIAKHADKLPLRGLVEPKPGHSNARNRAMREARGEDVVWTDDDVRVSSEGRRIIPVIRAQHA